MQIERENQNTTIVDGGVGHKVRNRLQISPKIT